ncbi:MAG: hypothetical protein OEY23_01910, partial [Acidimicrobiia bacterium]|nr:hypothetical protein [Acidimicrobiia bacterium]
MSRGDAPVDFLVSYVAEDRDWAEWIASHLGALGYGYRLQHPPTTPGDDPFAPIVSATAAGEDVVAVLSLAFVESLRASGAPEDGRLRGPGSVATVQIEPLVAPVDLRAAPCAEMYRHDADYSASRDLLIAMVGQLRPGTAPPAATGRAPLPAPAALDEAYPIPAPPTFEVTTTDLASAPESAPIEADHGRSAGLMGTDWSARPWASANRD